jgi:hypothetical protein
MCVPRPRTWAKVSKLWAAHPAANGGLWECVVECCDFYVLNIRARKPFTHQERYSEVCCLCDNHMYNYEDWIYGENCDCGLRDCNFSGFLNFEDRTRSCPETYLRILEISDILFWGLHKCDTAIENSSPLPKCLLFWPSCCARYAIVQHASRVVWYWYWYFICVP